MSPSNVLSLQGLQGQIIQVIVKSCLHLSNTVFFNFFVLVLLSADEPRDATVDVWQ